MPVLVLDEATANVSTAEDMVLQRVLREDFQNATVICVAHRLTSVIDCSRVLVLDRGHVLEYDTPAALVQRDKSHFRNLIESTGAASSRHLIALALKSNGSFSPADLLAAQAFASPKPVPPPAARPPSTARPPQQRGRFDTSDDDSWDDFLAWKAAAQ